MSTEFGNMSLSKAIFTKAIPSIIDSSGSFLQSELKNYVVNNALREGQNVLSSKFDQSNIDDMTQNVNSTLQQIELLSKFTGSEQLKTLSEKLKEKQFVLSQAFSADSTGLDKYGNPYNESEEFSRLFNLVLDFSESQAKNEDLDKLDNAYNVAAEIEELYNVPVTDIYNELNLSAGELYGGDKDQKYRIDTFKKSVDSLEKSRNIIRDIKEINKMVRMSATAKNKMEIRKIKNRLQSDMQNVINTKADIMTIQEYDKAILEADAFIRRRDI